MLALLCFIRRLTEFIQLHEPWQGIIATDNKSLIDMIYGPKYLQIGQIQATEFRRPLDPLSPEWDVVHQLLKSMPSLTLQHITSEGGNIS